MKKYNLYLLLVGIIFFTSCKPNQSKTGDFKLLPLPQQFDIIGVSSLKPEDILHYFPTKNNDLPTLGDLLNNIQKVDNQSDAHIIYTIDQSLDLPDEGYLLDISSQQININAKDQAGLLYGFMTLEQLLADAKEQEVNLPVCKIKDFPSLSYRAIHLDIKHHLDKTDYYYKLMDKLASYKINAIIAEVEDKIKYVRQPIVASADALSIAEWRKLSDYAKARNIEISPLIQGLGHASYILKHDQYQALRDDLESDWAFNPLNSQTYDVQFDMYLDAMEAMPHGKYLHIGGDEVHTTGRDSGKSALDLQLIWLDKVAKFAEKHGKTPIFWDDMPLKHAGVYRAMFNTKLTEEEVDSIWAENEHNLMEFLGRFPKNCIYMRWNYRASEALGNTKAMEWFQQHGMQVMAATAGQTRWVLMPLAESNIGNIKAFAESSIACGLSGLLLTLWDDDSPHFELYMRGIIAFAEYSWTGSKRTKEEMKSAYRQREFSYTLANKAFSFIDQLEVPVAFWKNALLKGNKRKYLKKSKNPIDKMVIELPNSKDKGAWTKVNNERLQKAEVMLLKCDSIAQKIDVMKSKAIHNIFNLEVYEQVNNLVRFAPKALLVLKDYDNTKTEQENEKSLNQIKLLSSEFDSIRKKFELVYGKTRILTKPKDYILDQDHHVHLANQSINFDWQFYAEMLFLEKLGTQF